MRKKNSTNFLNEQGLNEHCGMFHTLSLIGGRWKISILAVLLDHAVLRYGEIKSKVPGITERMLIKQLKELQEDALICRKDYGEVPPRVEYSLSKLGLSLEKILREMNTWGEKHKSKGSKI